MFCRAYVYIDDTPPRQAYLVANEVSACKVTLNNKDK